VRALRTNTHGAHVVRFTINGPLVHQSLSVAAVVPAGSSGAHRPVLVFLHGKGQDGGDDSYWHDRRDGRWGSYVMRQVIPQALARLGADPSRVAIGGISMGGFGALDLARLHRQRFCAVGGHSAAVWVAGGQTAAGAFDDARDFDRNSVIAASRSGDPYRSMRVWLDVGSNDPFRVADTTLARAIKAHGGSVEFHVWPGGHDQSYWESHWNDYLRFYANALADCHRR
jgi:S-formylglutathione hydrolase FrmB